jgi:hypothetical protein
MVGKHAAVHTVDDQKFVDNVMMLTTFTSRVIFNYFHPKLG